MYLADDARYREQFGVECRARPRKYRRPSLVSTNNSRCRFLTRLLFCFHGTQPGGGAAVGAHQGCR
jgi:hypothetical protein